MGRRRKSARSGEKREKEPEDEIPDPESREYMYDVVDDFHEERDRVRESKFEFFSEKIQYFSDTNAKGNRKREENEESA